MKCGTIIRFWNRPGRGTSWTLSGKVDLLLLGALLECAKLFFGVDSAPMHMAAALGTPVAAIFGPSGDVMWGPWQVANQTITGDCPERPCGRDGCNGSKVRPLSGRIGAGQGNRRRRPPAGRGNELMRIGLARFKYDDSGGAEKSLLLLAQGLMDRGHEVHVVTTIWQGDRPEGLHVHYAFVDNTPPRAQLKDWAMASRAQMAQCKVHTFLSLDRIPGSPVVRAGDGCHAAWLERRAVYCSALKRWSFKVNPKHRTFLDLERRTFAAPELQRVIANSNMVARELHQYCGVPLEKISVVYNGVDEKHLGVRADSRQREQARRELNIDKPALLFLGSGFERKGLDFAIRAMAHLPEADELLVVGQGPHRPLSAPGPQDRRCRQDQIRGQTKRHCRSAGRSRRHGPANHIRPLRQCLSGGPVGPGCRWLPPAATGRRNSLIRGSAGTSSTSRSMMLNWPGCARRP